MNLMWFRKDLRVSDNPALFNAVSHGDSIAVYCLCEKQWDLHSVSQAQRTLIVQQLEDLHLSLEKIGIPLIIVQGSTFSEVPGQLLSVAQKYNVDRLFFNHEYEVNEQKMTTAVSAAFLNAGMLASASHDQCLARPGTVLNKSGQPFKVFSAFKRTFYAQAHESIRQLYPMPKPQAKLAIASDLTALKSIQCNKQWTQYWPAGEDQAHQRLNHFIDTGVKDYHQHRDMPALAGTSTISPYLAVGILSARQCYQAISMQGRDSLLDGSDGISVWMNEIIWREFYRHLLDAFPKLSRHQPFKKETDQLPWRHHQADFDRWKQGETGFPIVDAAMKQLQLTGWMHNRLRMVTAMFLTKHLFIDWRWGEAYFMSMLVDGDLASNNGGWQWSASTGVDAVPYFRVFNPTRQSQRFDQDGVFIREFLPALKHLSNKDIHMPTSEQARKIGYPLPMVEHKAAVEKTKQYFSQLGKSVDKTNPSQPFSKREELALKARKDKEKLPIRA